MCAEIVEKLLVTEQSIDVSSMIKKKGKGLWINTPKTFCTNAK
jgi:hypothetical protein